MPIHVTECDCINRPWALTLSFQYTFLLPATSLQPLEGVAYLLNLKENEETW